MRIAIALGDPNGIGPEIAIKAATLPVRPLLVGDAHVIERTSKRLGVDTPPFVDVAALEPAGFAPGQLDPRAGTATVAYASAALTLTLEGKVDAVIGCPQCLPQPEGREFSGRARSCSSQCSRWHASGLISAAAESV